MSEWYTRVPHEQEDWSLNPRPAKSYTALQTVRHHFNIYASGCVAIALWCGVGHHKLVLCFGIIWWV